MKKGKSRLEFSTRFMKRNQERIFGSKSKYDAVACLSDKQIGKLVNDLLLEKISNYDEYDEEQKSFAKLKLILEYRIKELEKLLKEASKVYENEYYLDIEKEDYDFFKKVNASFKELLLRLSRHDLDNEDCTIAFRDFPFLCSCLDDHTYFSEEEKFNVIMYLVKRDIELLAKYREGSVLLMDDLDDEKVILERKNLKIGIETINKKYIQNSENYTFEDIKIILSSFEQIGVSKMIIDNIDHILRKKLKDRKTIEGKTVTDIKVNGKSIEVLSDGNVRLNNIDYIDNYDKKPIFIKPFYKARIIPIEIDKKEKRKFKTTFEMKEELKKYFYIDYRLKKDITKEEIIHCIDFMSLNRCRDELYSFLDLYYEKVRNDLFSSNLEELKHLYEENREKYKFYSSKGYKEIENNLKIVEEDFSLLVDENSEEFIEYVSTEIKSKLMVLEERCPSTYEYEFKVLESRGKGKNQVKSKNSNIELNKYICGSCYKIRRDVLEDDILYIGELLSSLEKDKNEIRSMILDANRQIEKNIRKSSFKELIEIFAENRDKYYFYAQKGKIDESKIKYLEEEMCHLIMKRYEDFTTSSIEEELLFLENSCPATCEYEFRTLEKRR